MTDKQEIPSNFKASMRDGFGFGVAEWRGVTDGMTPEQANEFSRKLDELARNQALRETVRSEGPFLLCVGALIFVAVFFSLTSQ